MTRSAADLTARVEQNFAERNRIFEEYFARESQALAAACREMSERFLRGGRLLAGGNGPYMTDAQHVSVEFVHPVIVGKRALPALDLSTLFESSLRTILQPDDIVMGFGPPDGDPAIRSALHAASTRGAMTFALPGDDDRNSDRSVFAHGRCHRRKHVPCGLRRVHIQLGHFERFRCRMLYAEAPAE